MAVTCAGAANTLFAAGAVGVGMYALFVYGILAAVVPLGGTVHPAMQVAFAVEKGAIYTHALASALALILGPFQVIPSWRNTHWLAHKWAGWVYVACAVAGGVSGVVVAQRAQGGLLGRVGFTLLGILWLVSTVGGVAAMACFRRRGLHETSMQVSCALAYAAVTLRVLLPVAITTDFQRVYGAIAWLCWVVNLLILAGLRWWLRGSRAAAVDPKLPQAVPGDHGPGTQSDLMLPMLLEQQEQQ